MVDFQQVFLALKVFRFHADQVPDIVATLLLWHFMFPE